MSDWSGRHVLLTGGSSGIGLAAVAPSVIAQAIVRGVERGKYLIVPGALSKFYRVLKSNALWLFFAITDGDVKAARRERGL